MIAISFLMIALGIIFASITGYLPLEMQFMMPMYLKMMLTVVGGIMAFFGFIMLLIRAQKTTAIHLLRPGRPGTILWLYIYKDGTAMFTPSMRSGEAQLYSAEMDSQIIDVKSYRIADHSLRIVPEVVGHAVDLDYVLYTDLLKTKFGFDNLKAARKGALAKVAESVGLKVKENIEGEENVAVGESIKEVSRKPNLTSQS